MRVSACMRVCEFACEWVSEGEHVRVCESVDKCVLVCKWICVLMWMSVRGAWLSRCA